MPGASHRPSGQIPLPGDGGALPPLPPPAVPKGLVHAFNHHERRTNSSEKSNNPSVATAGCDPTRGAAMGQAGVQGFPCTPLAWAAGYAAIYFSTSPCSGRVPLGLICCR